MNTVINSSLSQFDGATVAVTGGTGSFGGRFMQSVLTADIKEIRVFSRDEKKQDALRKSVNDPRVKFYIGDVRDREAVNDALIGVDYLFHAAALKQVPSCEFYPLEAVKTNILGTENVLGSAIANRVKRVVVLSTDKAVYPVNAMGISKAMMEKVAVAKSRVASDTVISITRYGNVMASRGSVIPLFVKQMRNGNALTITDPNMTRFMMTLDQAVSLVLYAFQNGNPGEIFVQKSPAATIQTVVTALLAYFNRPHYQTKIIGTRHGEKLHEVLLSREEMVASKDLDDYYCVSPDVRDLNYNLFFDRGRDELSSSSDYNSENTQRLDVDEVVALLHDVIGQQNIDDPSLSVFGEN